MKGQVFIILAAFLLIGLILLRVSTTTIFEKSQDFLSENFLNLKNELIHAVDISLLEKEDVQTNLNEFVSFSNEAFKQRGFSEDVSFSVDKQGNRYTIDFQVNLSLGNEYLNENFRIERTVYD